MACKEENKILAYVLGELSEKDRERVEAHVQGCASCEALMEHVDAADRVLRGRKPAGVPEGLAASCIQAIDEEAGRAPRKVRFEIPFLGRLFPVSPVWQFAVLLLVFVGGIGAGKVLFDSPTWLEQYGRLAPSENTQELSEGRMIRNYLLSVETLFLGLSNTESAAFLDEEDWEAELEVTREVLRRTRRMKRVLEEKNPELYQLVGEIEWVLEDIVGTSGWEFADLSSDVRQEIDERRLLMKIRTRASGMGIKTSRKPVSSETIPCTVPLSSGGTVESF